jgi:hypothetical protein
VGNLVTELNVHSGARVSMDVGQSLCECNAVFFPSLVGLIIPLVKRPVDLLQVRQ